MSQCEMARLSNILDRPCIPKLGRKRQQKRGQHSEEDEALLCLQGFVVLHAVEAGYL